MDNLLDDNLDEPISAETKGKSISTKNLSLGGLAPAEDDMNMTTV
jgi:hypothetical protein